MNEDVKKYVEDLVKSKLNKSDKELSESDIFKSSFSLGSTLTKGPCGNVMSNTRPHNPEADLAKAYKSSNMYKKQGVPKGVDAGKIRKSKNGYFHEEDINEVKDILEKSLFYKPAKIKESSNSKPKKVEIPKAVKKEMCVEDIHWKLDRMKRLQDVSWIAESEVPEVKEILESAFSKLKNEIKKKYEEYSKIK